MIWEKGEEEVRGNYMCPPWCLLHVHTQTG